MTKPHSTENSGEPFNFDEASRLAQSLGTDLGIRVKATLNMGSAELTTIPGSAQYAGEDIIEMAHRIAGNLKETHSTTAYVVLTRRDINRKESGLRFSFAMQSRSIRTAVVSIARLDMGENGGKANPATLRMRLAKMVKRSIGEMYYGYTRSADIQDVMYSPIMSLDDVDKMGSTFLHKPIRQPLTPPPSTRGSSNPARPSPRFCPRRARHRFRR